MMQERSQATRILQPFDFEAFLQDDLASMHREQRYRVFANLERSPGNPVHAFDHRFNREVTIWCSNDYLGMSAHADVISAAKTALGVDGAGAGGTRNIAGTSHEHVKLERELAELHGKDSALIFTSGYVANDASLSTLGRMLPDCLILSDELNHASMIEGIRRSGAEKQIFKHNDLKHLEHLLRNADSERPKIICFESCYSMDGDFSAIADICDLARRYNALTYLDEVHSVGLYGPGGAGIAALQGVSDHVDIIQGTLSKGFGSIGGYIAASFNLVDFVRSRAPGFIFSTALPPATVAGVRAAVKHLKENNGERERLHARVSSVKRRLIEAELPVFDSPSHILPIMIGDSGKAKRLTDDLMENYSVYAQPINFPTVPRGTERLRVTPNPHHTDADENHLIKSMQAVWSKHDVRRHFDHLKDSAETSQVSQLIL